MESAKSDLKSAKILIEAEEYKAANNRAYYAIFHRRKPINSLPEDMKEMLPEPEEIARAYDNNKGWFNWRWLNVREKSV